MSAEIVKLSGAAFYLATPLGGLLVFFRAFGYRLSMAVKLFSSDENLAREILEKTVRP